MIHKIYFKPPKGFSHRVEAAGCFCEWEGKLLYLKRHSDKPQGNTWGIPAGKIEKAEDARTAAIREVKEEVGLQLNPEDLIEVVIVYIQLEDVSYVFHVFRTRLQKHPSIILEPDAHTEAEWFTIDQALKLPLIFGGKEILEYYRDRLTS